MRIRPVPRGRGILGVKAMTEEQAEEIMMLVEDYGTYRYGQAKAVNDRVSSDYMLSAAKAWDEIWAKLKDHVQK